MAMYFVIFPQFNVVFLYLVLLEVILYESEVIASCFLLWKEYRIMT